MMDVMDGVEMHWLRTSVPIIPVLPVRITFILGNGLGYDGRDLERLEK